jgi:hypothetical protein
MNQLSKAIETSLTSLKFDTPAVYSIFVKLMPNSVEKTNAYLTSRSFQKTTTTRDNI